MSRKDGRGLTTRQSVESIVVVSSVTLSVWRSIRDRFKPGAGAIRLKLKKLNQFVLPFAVLAVLVTLTHLLHIRAREQHEEEIRKEFQFKVRNTIASIEHRMRIYRDVLAGARGLFLATFPSRSQFQRYVGALELETRYPGIQGVGFAKVIPGHHLKEFVESVRREGFPAFKFFPDGIRPSYSSILYLEPFTDQNRRAFGYDMYSDAVRRRAMEQSAETGAAVLSGKVKLVQETGIASQAGFLMYLPVYRPSKGPQSKGAKPQLLGWVYSPFRATDLMRGILGESVSDLDVEIYDGHGVSSENLLFDSGSSSTVYETAVKSARYSQLERIKIGDREWTVFVHSLPAFEKDASRESADTIQLIGMIGSMIAAFTFWLVMTSRERALGLVASKTRELTERNEISSWIHSIDEALYASSTYPEVIENLLACMIKEARWHIGAIWQVSDEGEELTLVQIRSVSSLQQPECIQAMKAKRISRGEGFPGRAWESRRVCADSLFEGDSACPEANSTQCGSIRSGLAIPIQSGSDMMGVLELLSEQTTHLPEAAMRDLEAVGLRIGQKLEKLRLENDLRAERDRLGQLMNAINASAIVSMTDANGTIISVNDKFCEVSGYSREELVGRDHRIVNSGLESKAFIRNLWETIRAGRTWSGEIRNRRKNGEIYTVASVIAPILNSDGDIEVYLSVRFDLTAEKEYHHQLVEAQATAKIGSWHFDLKTKNQSWSEEHYRIFEMDGPHDEDILFETYRSRIHPDDLPLLDRLLERAKLYGEDFVFDHRVVLDGGARIKYVQGVGKVQRNRSGEPVSISGTCQDVTERVTREAEYRMTLDALGIGVWKYNPITQDLIWDRSMLRLFDIEESDFTGRFEDWESRLVPATKAKAMGEFEKALRGERELNTTFEVVTKTGERKYVAAIASVARNHKGDPIMVVGLSWDRTKEFEDESRMAQQKALIETVFAHIPSMVFVKDYKNEMRFTLLNRSGENMLGVSAADLIGKNDFDIFPAEQAEFFTSKDREVFQLRTGITIASEAIQTPTGVRQVQTYKVPIFDQEGQPSLLIGVSTDITEDIRMQKQLEAERAKSVHNAKLASLGEMSAGIAHEINNPLAIIEGVARNIGKYKNDEEKFKLKIEALSKSVRRISRIVNGLRKFARASDGSDYVLMPVRRIFDEVSILTDAKANRHSVQVNYDVQTSARIKCDSVEIEQVFVNLINNGIDAVKNEDEKWLEVRAFEEGDDVVVQVTDSGRGIPAEVEAKLFQPFFTTKPVGQGTGLGLSIVKGILDQHHATIGLNSDSGHTCFEVRFKKPNEVQDAA